MIACAVELGNSSDRALIDVGDADLVRRIRWRLQRSASNGLSYARASQPGAEGRSRTLYLHRLLLDAPPGFVVDHINHNGLDNRRSNLRLCSIRENHRNQRQSKSQRVGGYKGTFWDNTKRRWIAAINAGAVKADGRSRRIQIGSFRVAEDAARAYDRAALQYFGEFAALNFPVSIAPAESVEIATVITYDPVPNVATCECCGAPFVIALGLHKKRFCSRRCQWRAWDRAQRASRKAAP